MDFDLFNLVFHILADLKNLSVAFCSFVVVIVIYYISGMWLVPNSYSNGISTLPCGTPDLTFRILNILFNSKESVILNEKISTYYFGYCVAYVFILIPYLIEGLDNA